MSTDQDYVIFCEPNGPGKPRAYYTHRIPWLGTVMWTSEPERATVFHYLEPVKQVLGPKFDKVSGARVGIVKRSGVGFEITALEFKKAAEDKKAKPLLEYGAVKNFMPEQDHGVLVLCDKCGRAVDRISVNYDVVIDKMSLRINCHKKDLLKEMRSSEIPETLVVFKDGEEGEDSI